MNTDQPDLFDPRYLAEAKAEDGIQRAGDHADAEEPGWTDIAAEEIRDYARSTGEPFLIEDVVAISRAGPPPDGRAWGAATRKASRAGWIVRIGYAPANSSNRSPKCLWASAEQRRSA